VRPLKGKIPVRGMISGAEHASASGWVKGRGEAPTRSVRMRALYLLASGNGEEKRTELRVFMIKGWECSRTFCRTVHAGEGTG